ncbi:MAG TPA: DUF3147 family protein [Candidatus Dormibacteraeota bacterium]|nr:DUF3147 family protein [Candidatus Dormibacteraeota bacterium]
MKDAGIILVRAVLGGAFVVAFSVLSEVLRPKSFSGIFAAAPSVALASLLVTTFVHGPAAVALAATGMIVGALGMIAAAVVGVDAVKRLRGLKGSLAAIAVWLMVAGGVYAVALR